MIVIEDASDGEEEVTTSTTTTESSSSTVAAGEIIEGVVGSTASSSSSSSTPFQPETETETGDQQAEPEQEKPPREAAVEDEPVFIIPALQQPSEDSKQEEPVPEAKSEIVQEASSEIVQEAGKEPSEGEEKAVEEEIPQHVVLEQAAKPDLFPLNTTPGIDFSLIEAVPYPSHGAAEIDSPLIVAQSPLFSQGDVPRPIFAHLDSLFAEANQQAEELEKMDELSPSGVAKYLHLARDILVQVGFIEKTHLKARSSPTLRQSANSVQLVFLLPVTFLYFLS